METDFRIFFLLVKTIIEIRWDPVLKNIPRRESFFLLWEADLLASANHFFLHFSETLETLFFPYSGKVFSLTKSFIPASENGFSS